MSFPLLELSSSQNVKCELQIKIPKLILHIVGFFFHLENAIGKFFLILYFGLESRLKCNKTNINKVCSFTST